MKKNRLLWELGWPILIWFIVAVGSFYLAIALAGVWHTSPLGGFFLWLLPVVLLAWLLNTRIVRPIGEIARVAREMAQGNLDRQIMVEGDENLEGLARSINILAGRLRKVKRRVAEETDLSRAILNSMLDGVVALDREGRVRMVNRAVERTFGVSESACLGKGVVGAVRSIEFERMVKDVLADGLSVVEEMAIFTPQPRSFRIHITPLAAGGGGVVAILRDTTEARHLERVRSDFFANVSHELRTPLTSINGFLETLLDGSLDDEATTRHFLEIMSTEAERLSRLIDDLFVLSDIENHRRPFNKEAVDMDTLIGKIEDMFTMMAQERGITLTTSVAADLPPVLGDEDLITQLMINLVENAVKYTPIGGTVEVKAFLDETSQVAVRVADTGVGIREEDLSRIFERFYRVDKARSREQGGTGLGLSIVKHIVETLGGLIEVESQPGTGSIFTVRLSAYHSMAENSAEN